jgi:hypothetical protein
LRERDGNAPHALRLAGFAGMVARGVSAIPRRRGPRKGLYGGGKPMLTTAEFLKRSGIDAPIGQPDTEGAVRA